MCWSFTNYPGQGIFPPLAAQANFWGTGQGRASFDQQHNCQKISSFMSKFTHCPPRPIAVRISFTMRLPSSLIFALNILMAISDTLPAMSSTPYGLAPSGYIPTGFIEGGSGRRPYWPIRPAGEIYNAKPSKSPEVRDIHKRFGLSSASLEQRRRCP